MPSQWSDLTCDLTATDIEDSLCGSTNLILNLRSKKEDFANEYFYSTKREWGFLKYRGIFKTQAMKCYKV